MATRRNDRSLGLHHCRCYPNRRPATRLVITQTSQLCTQDIPAKSDPQRRRRSFAALRFASAAAVCQRSLPACPGSWRRPQSAQQAVLNLLFDRRGTGGYRLDSAAESAGGEAPRLQAKKHERGDRDGSVSMELQARESNRKQRHRAISPSPCMPGRRISKLGVYRRRIGERRRARHRGRWRKSFGCETSI